MADSAALTAHLVALVDELTSQLGEDVEHVREPLEALVGDLKSAIDSFVGVQLIIITDGRPVRLSLFDPADGAGSKPIGTSLRIPLNVLAPADSPIDADSSADADRSTDGDSTITFYAATPGAFVDLAADLEYALDRPKHQRFGSDPPQVGPDDHRVSVDRHLVPVSVVSGLFGLAELSVISMAVGALIDRGHRPEDAPAELRRRADAEGVSSHTYAAGYLQHLTDHPPASS